MRVAEAHIAHAQRKAKNGSGIKCYGTAILILPSKLVTDSAFPFDLPARVRVSIEGNKVVIEKFQE